MDSRVMQMWGLVCMAFVNEEAVGERGREGHGEECARGAGGRGDFRPKGANTHDRTVAPR